MPLGITEWSTIESVEKIISERNALRAEVARLRSLDPDAMDIACPSHRAATGVPCGFLDSYGVVCCWRIVAAQGTPDASQDAREMLAPTTDVSARCVICAGTGRMPRVPPIRDMPTDLASLQRVVLNICHRVVATPGEQAAAIFNVFAAYSEALVAAAPATAPGEPVTIGSPPGAVEACTCGRPAPYCRCADGSRGTR